MIFIPSIDLIIISVGKNREQLENELNVFSNSKNKESYDQDILKLVNKWENIVHSEANYVKE